MIDPSGAKIRRAAMPDLPRVAELFDGYRQFYGQLADPDGARQFLRERLQSGDSVILVAVAEKEKRLAGFVQLYPSFSSVSMKRLWILNDLFVAPAHRRGGVARALLASAEDFARATSAKGLLLATQKNNAPAKSLYEARGWKLDDLFDHYLRYF
ncbi:MAG TPA: GNAT family N-acetyltransferase [Polyangia bacterium]